MLTWNLSITYCIVCVFDLFCTYFSIFIFILISSFAFVGIVGATASATSVSSWPSNYYCLSFGCSGLNPCSCTLVAASAVASLSCLSRDFSFERPLLDLISGRRCQNEGRLRSQAISKLLTFLLWVSVLDSVDIRFSSLEDEWCTAKWVVMTR